MKDIFSIIKSRRTCKQFKGSITKDDLILLCEYASYAPSAGGMQDYRFIVSKDKQRMKLLPQLCMDQDHVSQAGGIIIVCSQPTMVEEYFPEQAKQFASQGASAAIQNILLAAEGLGLGAAWIGGMIHSEVKKLYSIPEDVQLEAIIAIGHPYNKAEPKQSKQLGALLYYDDYGNPFQDIHALKKDYSVKLEKKIESYEHRLQKIQNKLKGFFN